MVRGRAGPSPERSDKVHRVPGIESDEHQLTAGQVGRLSRLVNGAGGQRLFRWDRPDPDPGRCIRSFFSALAMEPPIRPRPTTATLAASMEEEQNESCILFDSQQYGS